MTAIEFSDFYGFSGGRISNLCAKPSDSLICRRPGFWTNILAVNQSRSQRLHSFWSAPRMQDLWDNQCQNADKSKSDWLLKFTGSLRVRSFKTGNENVLLSFCCTFSITSETDSGKEIRKWAIQGLYKLPKNRYMLSNSHSCYTRRKKGTSVGRMIQTKKAPKPCETLQRFLPKAE